MVLSVKVDADIQREETNLRSKLSIDYTDAILGTVATVTRGGGLGLVCQSALRLT